MPNGGLVTVPAPAAGVSVVRCIKVSSKAELHLLAKLLGINAKKTSEMQVATLYIVQDLPGQTPLKTTGCDPTDLMPKP